MKKMNKTELVKKISDKCGYTQKDIKDVLDIYESIIIDAMKVGEDVKTGIMTFMVKDTKPKVARNLQTGEVMNLPASKKVSIKLSKTLKESAK